MTIREQADRISRLESEILEMRRISPAGEILNHQSGGDAELRMDSSGPIAQQESSVTAPTNLRTQQIVEASPNINSVDIRNAPSTATMDRRVPMSKYCSIVPTSTEIAKKTSVSNKDKSFDNIDILDKASRASNLLSLADGSRKPPDVTAINCLGYTAGAIKPTIKADDSSSHKVIAEDDYYKYFADSIVAYTFMLSMMNKDMFGEAINDEDPTRLYKIIQEHFKGGKNHHVESARRKLNAHRFGPGIERDISRLLVLISELEVAQNLRYLESCGTS